VSGTSSRTHFRLADTRFPTEDHLSGKDIEDRGNDGDEWEDYDEGQAGEQGDV
jgi:hypothetical protein